MKEIPKFDVVIGDPPFLSRPILDFFKSAFNMSKKYIVWTHQTGWLFDRLKPGDEPRGKYMELKKLINGKTESIKLFNANPFIPGRFVITPMAINFIDKDKKDEKIQVEDIINNEKVIYPNAFGMNKWSNLKIYPVLEKKFLDLSLKDNLNNHNGKEEGKYYVNGMQLGGQIETKTPKKIYGKGMFVFMNKKAEVTNSPLGKLWWSFETSEEAQNFLDFCKTKWARFGLSIPKIYQINYGDTWAIPWLDWKQKWTDKKFEEFIKATPEEIAFVNEKIPNYY